MDPVPWVPAVVQHTSTGASEDAELYVVRAIETGIIDVSTASVGLWPKRSSVTFAVLSRHAGISGKEAPNSIFKE